MLIDWFSVIAQIVNFFILVWLLKRFLYRPILDAVDARESRIAKQLTDADVKMAEALQERKVFQQKNEAFDREKASLFNQTIEEARLERQHLLSEARASADQLAKQRQALLRAEQKSLEQELSRCTREEVFAIARKALSDLAGVSLEARMVDLFLQRLGEMEDQARQDFTGELLAASEVRVRSRFVLSTDQRESIQKALSDTFAREIPLQFITEPTLISGIEISTGGHQLAWSIDEYLSSLEKRIDQLLKNNGSADGS